MLKTGKRSGKEMFKYMIGYIKAKLKILSFFAIVAFLTTGLSIVLPYYNGRFIDSISYKPNKATVVNYAIFIAILLISSIFINYLYGILNTKIKLDLSYNMYSDIISHIQKIPYIVYKKYNPTYLNQRINTDIARLWSFFLVYFINIFIQALSLIILIVLIFELNVYIFVVTLFLIPIYVSIYVASRKPIYMSGLESKEKMAEYFKTGNEQLDQVAEIKSNSLYDASAAWLSNSYEKYKNSLMRFTKVSYFFKSLDSSISMFLQVSIILIGGYDIINGNLTFGEFVILNSYYNMLFKTIKFFFTVGQEYQDTKNSYDRIKEIVTIPEENIGNTIIKDISTIELKNISYKYEKKEVIREFSYKFEKGNIYLIEGKNGSGKTTLLLLLIGMLQEQGKGDIYFNNVSISDVNMKSLRSSAISTYLQNSKMFDSTVLEVISFYTGLNENEIKTKINQSVLKNIYMSKELDVIKCFEKSIRKLSGGEQQKIRLLCSLLLNCSVLILDEPTSQIDKQSSMIIKDYLESEKKNRIIIIVTHDIKLANDFQDAKRLNLKLLRGEETC